VVEILLDEVYKTDRLEIGILVHAISNGKYQSGSLFMATPLYTALQRAGFT